MGQSIDSIPSWPISSPPLFGFSNIQGAMSCPATKRQREPEDLIESNEESVHEKKKHRPLPLRTSPKASQRSSFIQTSGTRPRIALSALTPVESSDDEDGLNKQITSGLAGLTAPQSQLHTQSPSLVMDTSMDIDTCEDIKPTDGYVDNASPAAGGLSHNNNHMLSYLSGFAYPSLATDSSASITSAHGYSQPTTPSISLANREGLVGLGSETVPNTPCWRNPRLPSPVSDAGDAMASEKGAFNDSEMTYNVSHPESPPIWNESGMDTERTCAADVEEQTSSLDLPSQGHIESTSSPRPGKKLAFSMGYRADCDKCRRKVPGHYSHIIRG